MATTALGIMQDSAGNGVDPHTHRKIIQARWSNPGVITGLSVTGGSGLTYSVSAGCAVVTRGESDGYAEAYFEGGSTPAVSAGDPSNPRVDLVWIKANDIQQGDDDNRVHVGVTSGTPAASPVAPSAPAGCLPIASMLVPAGATSTASAQMDSERDYAIPYGATMGRIGYYRDTVDGIVDTPQYTKSRRYSVSVNLPTDRVIELRFTGSAMCSGTAGQHTCWYVSFALDGEEIPYSGGEFWLETTTTQTVSKSFSIEVPSGTHSFSVMTGWVSGEAAPVVKAGPYDDYGGGAAGKFTGTFPGRIFEVWDRGIV